MGNGKTRDERIAEFCAINPSEYVIAVREGSLLHVAGDELECYSVKAQGFKVFRYNQETQEYFDTQALAEMVPFRCR